MSFYNLSKEARAALFAQIGNDILTEIQSGVLTKTADYFADGDTYIRKSAYLSVGKIYLASGNRHTKIVRSLEALFLVDDFKTRQTVINAAGEIGKTDFESVQAFFDRGLFDTHHAVRNAVIGSVKKMGEVNPLPVLQWAKRYLHHEDKEIRREVCHGIELRGRKYPQDILPLLQELQHDKTSRVRNTLVHVLGQIAYKKGCLETVIRHLTTWDNRQLVRDALEEIIDVHHRYKDFSALTQEAAREYILQFFPDTVEKGKV